MRNFIFCIIIFLSSITCNGQSKILSLQQVDIQQKYFEDILTNIIKSESDCFNRNQFYFLNFFLSGLTNNIYYISINEITINSQILDSMTYYTTFNNKVFFIPQKFPNNLFRVQPTKKKFTIKEKNEIPCPGGDFNFFIYATIINGTSETFFQPVFKTCSE